MTVIYCFMIRQRGLKWMRGRSTFASCRRAQQDAHGRTRSAGRARQDADKDPEDKEDIEE